VRKREEEGTRMLWPVLGNGGVSNCSIRNVSGMDMVLGENHEII
jgi:hypothetical protein